jgi:hypothetical protein
MLLSSLQCEATHCKGEENTNNDRHEATLIPTLYVRAGGHSSRQHIRADAFCKFEANLNLFLIHGTV